MYEYIATHAKDIDLVMVVPHESRPYWQSWNFRAVTLKDKLHFRLAFAPYLLANKIAQKKMFEVPALSSYEGMNVWLDAEKPQLIIANVEHAPTTWQAASWCKKHDVPLIIQTELQRMPNEVLSKIATRIFLKVKKRLFTQAAHITAWTNQGVKFAQVQLAKAEPQKVMLLPLAVDTEFFKPHLRKRKSGKTLRILMVARFVPYKRHHDAIDAIANLRAEGISVQLDLLGKGPNKEIIAEYIEAKGLQSQVHMIDDVQYKEMPRLYAQYDALLLASMNEAIGVVVPEALSCAVPVIVSDTSGATTYIEQGKNGFIFETGNVPDLTQNIKLLCNQATRIRMGIYARKSMQKRFSIQNIGKQWISLIRSTARTS